MTLDKTLGVFIVSRELTKDRGLMKKLRDNDVNTPKTSAHLRDYRRSIKLPHYDKLLNKEH